MILRNSFAQAGIEADTEEGQRRSKEGQKNCVIVSQILELQFGNQHIRQVFQSQLKLRAQQPNENLQEFKFWVELLSPCLS